MPVNRVSKFVLVAVACLVLTPAFAKSDKPVLPEYFLRARTVAVIIDPRAGISLEDPNANQTAQHDVETALLKWGRFQTVIGAVDADLVIVVRKGSGKLAGATISDPRQNSRVGSASQTDGRLAIGVQHGTPPPNTAGAHDPSLDGGSTARPQAEIGNVDDSFQVFEGKTDNDPTDAPAGWRWIHKNGLHSHDVPAVDEFRKAIEAAEKQAAAQQKTTPSAKHP
ncbi:MAG TPA: hypothetical protein VF865_04095 [Acidobacteriaceae bacterium]